MYPPVMLKEFHTRTPAETARVAAGIAVDLQPGTVIALHGDLGAGKTCFTQGLAAALGIQQEIVSPTYTLVSEYAGRLKLNHIDLYRIRNAQEALNLGIEDYLFPDGVTVIEWAERIESLLPPGTMHIHLQPGEGEYERTIRVEQPS